MGVIASQVKNKADADDLYHDLFLSLLQQPIPDGVKDVRAYLYRAIVNDIMNLKLRRQRHGSKMRDLYGLRPQQVQSDPADQSLHLEQLARAYELIEERRHLREMQAVELRYRQECTTDEAACEMAVVTRTIDRYVCIGLKELRKLMVREFGDQHGSS